MLYYPVPQIFLACGFLITLIVLMIFVLWFPVEQKGRKQKEKAQ